ncbi:MAG: tRNA (adenosine(37)-N6)-threonylcarbamoyltransferase complex dimerization subunit type 1 TsaB [Pseudohongiella sp.]|nr:tRNA (adenosine(37)-N6)-threonylcarbamoyltransferase complex dimerization subunit type 1 TsaB [Pseudohongiella sp.]MDP2127677.1 tRNA (adenosine(37)-N6)-threonylcarbamoyltransferase complex dimerization subunit type 1 TsaB [Pseudohongiella sp.]
MQSTTKFPSSQLHCSLLAIDTAFDICSVALVTPELSDIRRSEQSRKHADDVLPMIDRMLCSHNMEIGALDVLAMVSGPGSFTGLRIGTAVVQGLAFGASLPVVCVSSLALMARSARHTNGYDGLVLTCLHAREDEFYFAAYHDNLDDAPQALVVDTILTASQIRQSVNDLLPGADNRADTKATLAGTGWQHALLTDLATLPEFHLVTAATDALLLAELAAQEFKAGRAVDASEATPAYLKDDMEYRMV